MRVFVSNVSVKEFVTYRKQLMSDMNINQTELANRTGLKQPNINRVLSEKQSMQLSTLEKMPKDFSS